MITIREYAKQKNVSYEAVRKQLSKYKETELKDHIIKQGKTQYLDEYAVEFLDTRRRESPVMVVQLDKDEEIERLKAEKEILVLKIAQLQDDLLKEKDQVKILQAEKIELLEQKQDKKSFWQRLFG